MTVVELKANIDPSYYRLLYGQERNQLADMFQAKRPSVEERLAAGKALREKVPRTAHAAYDKAADRPDPVDILEKTEYRGASRSWCRCGTRACWPRPSPSCAARRRSWRPTCRATPVTGLAVSACGDMHVSNFGVFASAERNLVFAINDFDEVHPGPWEWDLKRLAASAVVAVRFMGGDKAAAAEAAARDRGEPTAGACGATPRWAISRSGTTRSTSAQMLEALSPARAPRRRAHASPRRGPRAISRSLDKLTEQVNGEPRIVEDVPLIVRESPTEQGTPVQRAP